MCGIAGIVSRDRLRAPDAERLRGMMDTLAHRGPDGEGLYVDRVSGELELVSSQPDPVEGAEVNLSGTLESGARYDVTEVAQDGFNSATAWFSPQTTFQDGSDLCIRTKIGAVDFSEPTCVTIHA